MLVDVDAGALPVILLISLAVAAEQKDDDDDNDDNEGVEEDVSSTHKPVISLKVSVSLAHEGKLGIDGKENAIDDDTEGEEPGPSIVPPIDPRKKHFARSGDEQGNDDNDDDGLDEPPAAALLYLGRRERDVDGERDDHTCGHDGPRSEIKGVLELGDCPHHAIHPGGEGNA